MIFSVRISIFLHAILNDFLLIWNHVAQIQALDISKYLSIDIPTTEKKYLWII